MKPYWMHLFSAHTSVKELAQIIQLVKNGMYMFTKTIWIPGFSSYKLSINLLCYLSDCVVFVQPHLYFMPSKIHRFIVFIICM